MPAPILFDAANWYWTVGGDTTRVYSSAVADYVPVRDAAYVAWVTEGHSASQMPTEQELWDYLNGRAIDATPPTATSTDAAKEQRIAQQLSEVIYQIAFSHENRIRALEGVGVTPPPPPLTREQFYGRVKGLMK